MNDFFTEVVKLEINVISILTTSSALEDFGHHGTSHNVTSCEILRIRRITLHEPFAILVN